MYHHSGGAAVSRGVTSPDSALASDVFDKYCNAVTFKSILSLYRQLCELLRLKPTYFPHFYPKLKAKLRSWKAQALWSKFDKRAAHRCYNRGKPCANTRVLIIGGGPCGLRTAIEAQLLGAKVVVVEKRDRFSRNNVLHLWPFVIHDLRALGAKKFFGKFCAGSIDHISIRQLQCILLKVALLLGVEVHENVTFESLIPPPEDQSIKIGWKAKVSPADHPVSQYEFDVLIGADGKRNTLEGFKRKEFRGRLAIAITANFINRKSEAEARVEEISGVAFIFNQKFFKDLNSATGIDLENIVYYKDETHYFVMTAKKQSLLNKGVIIQDYPDTVKLLSPENVNKEALMDYAREAADFSTNYQLPHLDFALNHYGQPDVAMFDFTSMFAAENASRVLERRGHKLLMGIVGDSLLEPFWPTGSGCARGWLSSFDACWAIHSWSTGKMTPLEVVAERESIYRLLAQTTPENLNKDYSAYTVEPQTRYPNLNTRVCLDFQVKCFYDTDNPAELERPAKTPAIEEGTRKRTKRPAEAFIHPDTLLAWLKKQIALYDMTITDLTTSFQDGLALCAIIHRYRPDLLDFASLDPANVAGNNQLAFDILEELGIPPVTTGFEMAQSDVPDKLAMLCYLTQVHELFRGEIPCVKQPKRELAESDDDVLGACAKSTTARRAVPPPVSTQRTARLSSSSKRRSLERGSSGEGKLGGDRHKVADSSLRKGRKRRSTDRPQHNTADRERVRQEVSANRLERKQRMAAFLRLQFDRSTLMLQAADPFQAGGFSKATENQMKEERNMADDMAMFLYRLESDFEDKRRRLERMLFYHPDDRSGKPGPRVDKDGSESLSNKVRDLEAKLKGNRAADKKPKDLIRAVGKLDKTDWQLSALEKKIEDNQNPSGGFKMDPHEKKVPKWNRDAFTDKLEAMNRRIHGLPTEAYNEKFVDLERGMKQLERKLKEGSVLETGNRGSNKVSAMAQQLAKKAPHVAPAPVIQEAESFRPKPVLNLPQQGGSEVCHFCKKRVYLMERMSAEGKFFHRGCFRCEYCATTLRLSGYAFVRDDVLGGLFFCMPHVSMTYYMRSKLQAGRAAVDRGDGRAGESDRSEPTEESDQPVRLNPEETKIKNPLLESARHAAEDFRRDGTPERVEFENSIAMEAAEEELSEIDEDEWTDHNFGNSVNSGSNSDEDVSSLDSSDDEEEEDEEESNENIMELDRPLTADETRRLAESWKKRYSTDPVASASDGHQDQPQETLHEVDEESGVSIDVPAFPVPPERRNDKKSGEETSSDTEMGSDEELDVEEEGDYEEESEYENGGEEEEEVDEEGEEEEEDGEEEEEDEDEEEELQDSATEIETDSEFDQNSSVEVCVGPQGIPTIVVDETEAELKKSTDHLANGDGDMEDPSPSRPKEHRAKEDPLPEYVHQYVPLDPARPLQRTLSNDSAPQSSVPRSGVLAYLRRSELLEKSPSAADMMASKNSLELKKKYLLDYPGPVGSSLTQKSASTTNLDSKLKSFVDKISEAQNKLNPAPQPSVPMQVFLQNTGNIFQSTPRIVPNHLPLKEEVSTSASLSTQSSEETPVQEPDLRKEPPTPTNVPQEPLTPVAEGKENGSLALDPPPPPPETEPTSDDDQPDEEEEESSEDESEASGDTSSDEISESEAEVEDRPPVPLPNVVVQQEEEPEEPSPAALASALKEVEEPQQPSSPAVQPKLAVQEDFDLSPSSEVVHDIVPEKSSNLHRAPSKESVDSAKFALTETEFSDWGADNSLGGDLDGELDLDSLEVGSELPKATAAEHPVASSNGNYSGPVANLEDIGFADESEAPALNLKGYTQLVEEVPSPDFKLTDKSVEESPELSSMSFGRQRDSIAVYREKQQQQAAHHPPIPAAAVAPKEEKAKPDMKHRMLDKRSESSPNLTRKKQTLSQERERQGDLVRDMVMSRIQRSPDKQLARERRGSYGSLITPPGSSRASRSDSEPRNTPDRQDPLAASQTPLYPLAEARSNEFITPTNLAAFKNNESGQMPVKRELFTPSRPAEPDFKTPSLKEWQDATADRQQSARKEARAKAQAKADQDLGLSPPDYIENLKDKLRRKPSVSEEAEESFPQRTRSFSEPQPEPEGSSKAALPPYPSDLFASRKAVPQAPSAIDAIAAAAKNAPPKPPRTPVPPPPPAPLKSAKSVPQMLSPPSPRSEVIGHLFLQQQQERPSSSSPTSPPLSPNSTGSSKSASYLWAGISPADSQLKLDDPTADAAAASASSSTSPSAPIPQTRSVPPKKSKDRERRRSLIQTFTDLFKKDEVKELPEASTNGTNGKQAKASPSKFQLFKLSPRKEKSKEKLSDEAESGRLRSSSSPMMPTNAESPEESVKPRAGSYAATPSSSDATPNSSMMEPRPGSSSSTGLPKNSPWSALSLSASAAGPRRASKQARQAARQTELKRLRMAQSIQRELEEIEVKQKELEDQGVRLEKALRGEDGGLSGRDESALMQEWFQLVHEKNALGRYEQELMVRAKKLELEDRHARLQQELKDRMSVDESMKSQADVDKEGAILAEMLKIVEQEDWLTSMLEEDRQRYREEDRDLENQMLAKGLRVTSLRQRKESQV